MIKSGTKQITLDNRRAHVRTVAFRERTGDPYVLAHEVAAELEDGRLAELYSQWVAVAETRLNTAEEFEEFLDWLETDCGFLSLAVKDEMYCFN